MMDDGRLEVEAALQVSKPVDRVFEAIVDPAEMTNYFISRSSGRLIEGEQVTWGFPEFEADFPITVDKVVKDSFVSFHWEVDGEMLHVEITLSPVDGGSTVVTITEKSRENDEAGILWLRGNTAGWANFLACLKAYLEYGVNLRKGAFDFLRK